MSHHQFNQPAFPAPKEDLRVAMAALARSLHCALPCEVQSFDPATQTVSVRPVIQDRLQDGTPISLPLLTDVPVFFPGTATSAITWTVQPGDFALVIFADSCIDAWFTTGETDAPPPLIRSHDLSDGFAFVGFRPKSVSLPSIPESPSLFGFTPDAGP